MKLFTTKVFILFSLFTLLITFPQFTYSQTKIIGELTLAENSSSVNGLFATVNGERAESGRSIMSPSEISTPSSVNAKIAFTNVGSVTLSPNSNLNLSFDGKSISGNLQSGEFIIYSNPGITVNFSTPDGTLTVPVSNSLNSFEVKINDGKTTVYSILGTAQFNGNQILAGEYYPKQNSDKNNSKSSGGVNNSLLIVGLLGAVGAGVLIALAGSSDSNNNNSSPVR